MILAQTRSEFRRSGQCRTSSQRSNGALDHRMHSGNVRRDRPSHKMAFYAAAMQARPLGIQRPEAFPIHNHHIAEVVEFDNWRGHEFQNCWLSAIHSHFHASSTQPKGDVAPLYGCTSAEFVYEILSTSNHRERDSTQSRNFSRFVVNARASHHTFNAREKSAPTITAALALKHANTTPSGDPS